MKRVVGIFITAVALMIAGSLAHGNISDAAGGSASLSIPPKKNYNIKPGKSIEDTLVITNSDKAKSLHLSLHTVDFTYMDNSGTPKLLLKDDEQKPWSLKPYLKVPKEVTIAPNTSQTIDMSIKIPSKLGAGSYYSAVMYSTGDNTGSVTGLSASGVTLVFVSVPGKVKESLSLQGFGAYSYDPSDSSKSNYLTFSMHKPKYIGYTLKNDGNVTEAPVGSISYKYMFGKEHTINDVNPKGSLALIGQSRTFRTCFKSKKEQVDFNGSRSEAQDCVEPTLWPGLYKLKLDVYYGHNGNNTQEVTGESSFWYLPLWFDIPAIIVLLLIIFGIWKSVSSVRNKMYGPKMKKSSRRKK